MENIDELMRQQLNGEDPSARFAFREEYWEQAEALLIADERARRRRRALLWWWLLAGLLLAGGGMYWLAGRKTAENAREKSPEVTSVGPATDRLRSKGSATFNGERTGSQIMDQGDTALTNRPTGGPAAATTATSKPGNQEPFNREKKENPKAMHSPAPRGNTNPPIGNRSVNLLQRQSDGRFWEAPTVKNAGADQPGPGGSPSPNNAESLENQPLHVQATVAKPVDSLANRANEAMRWNVLSGLPTPLMPLAVPPRPLPKATRIMPAQAMIVPNRERKWSVEIAAAGTAIRPEPIQGSWGAVGGIAVSRKLGEAWSLHSGVRWRYDGLSYTRPYGNLYTSQQARYSFGYIKDDYELKRKGLHWLELPLSIGLRKGRWSAEAGATADLLVAAQGQVTHRHRESLSSGVQTTVKKGWVDKSPYEKTKLSGFAGLGWQATPRLGFALQAFYRPGTVANFEGPNLPVDPYSSPDHTWWLDLGARFRLF